MKTPLLNLLALLLLALLVRFSSVAAPLPGPHPARQQIRAYYEATVLPVLRQQRQKLETRLSAEEKTQLATYRSQLRSVRQRGTALRQSLQPAGPPTPTRPALTAAQRQQVQQLRAEARGILLRVAQIAQTHDADIAQLAEEIQPQKEQWTIDIKAIVARNTTPEQQQGLGRFARRRLQGGVGSFSRPVRFLLLDPHASLPTEAAAPGSTVFPNPAATTTQLQYSVKKAGPVTVEVLDTNGTVLQTLTRNEQQEKGSHTVSASVSALPAGTYLYRITTRSGVETKRFVKQ